MSKKFRIRFYLYLTIIFFLVFYFFLSIPYFSGDVNNHIVWGRSILDEGPGGFYGRYFHDYSFPNYPPISMLSFAGSVVLFDWVKNSIMNLNHYPVFPSGLVNFINYENVLVSFLKIPAILPFVLSAGAIFYFAKLFKKSDKKAFIYMLLFLLNPAFFYLAVIWGQNDFTQVFFVLLAIYYLLKENFYATSIFAGFAILSKQTALMIWGIILLAIFKNYGFIKAIIAGVISLVLLWIFYIPFNNTGILWPFIFYNETLRTTGLLVADNAINFWGLISQFQPMDSQATAYLKLEHWGFLFFTALFLPLLYKFAKNKFTSERFIYFLFLASIIYFFALTRMHERYIIFGVVFAQILFMKDKKYLCNLVFFSLLLFVNLYKGLFLPDVPLLKQFSTSIITLNILGFAYLSILAFNYYYFMYKLKDEKN